MKGVLRSLVAVVLLAFGVSGAVAEPVQQFNVQLKDLTPDGRYSVVFTSNAFDTTGDAPPVLTDAFMRLAKGMSIKPGFLRRDRLCETAKFAGLLFQNRPPGVSYAQMVDDLPRSAQRIERRLTPTGRGIVATCRNAFFGSGRTIVDARPLYRNPIPARFSLVLTRSTAKGAIVGVGVISHYDRASPIATDDPRETALQPIFTLNLYDDPTPDGRYGYRMKLLAENAAGLRFSVAELRVESKGIVRTTERRTCTARRGGSCVRYTSRRTSEFWANLPACPASGKLPFRADYRYTTGLRTTTVIQVPCPRFQR